VHISAIQSFCSPFGWNCFWKSEGMLLQGGREHSDESPQMEVPSCCVISLKLVDLVVYQCAIVHYQGKYRKRLSFDWFWANADAKLLEALKTSSRIWAFRQANEATWGQKAPTKQGTKEETITGCLKLC